MVQEQLVRRAGYLALVAGLVVACLGALLSDTAFADRALAQQPPGTEVPQTHLPTHVPGTIVHPLENEISISLRLVGTGVPDNEVIVFEADCGDDSPLRSVLQTSVLAEVQVILGPVPDGTTCAVSVAEAPGFVQIEPASGTIAAAGGGEQIDWEMRFVPEDATGILRLRVSVQTDTGTAQDPPVGGSAAIAYSCDGGDSGSVTLTSGGDPSFDVFDVQVVRNQVLIALVRDIPVTGSQCSAWPINVRGAGTTITGGSQRRAARRWGD